MYALNLNAQFLRWHKPNAGIQGGLVLNFGSHETSIGVFGKAFVGFDYAQLNVGNTFKWNLFNLGKRKLFYENRAYFGAALMVGKDKAYTDFELDGLAHQTQKDFAVSFNYLIYTDNAGTSQLSGAWGLYLRNVQLRFENDVFAGQARDRFRTGILTISYRNSWYKLNAGLSIWTGETRGSTWEKLAGEKMPSGYRSLEDLPYGKTSHGIIYVGGQFLMPIGNNHYSVKVGIDSEHFRHFFQNRLIHDLSLLPKKVKRNTPHYPRLDEDGCPTFERNSVRKTVPFIQFGLNE